ncbi:peptidoglycan recognition protein family protein [Bacillus mobilis]
MQLESRSTVGLPGVGGVSTNITPGNGGCTIHYVGSAVGIPMSAPHSRCRAKVREIHNWHVRGNGWAFGAYSLVVCQAHGIVMEMRGARRRTAANGTNSGNQNWYAILGLIGGSEKPSDAMVQGIKDAVAYLRKSGGAASRVNGHRDHLSTSCPGAPLYDMVRAGVFGSGGSSTPGGGASKPAKPGTKAPKFPLSSGHWFGPESSSARNHSGFHTSARPGIRQIRDRLRARGWSVAAGDRYDTKLAGVIKQFQREKKLGVDGLTGAQTWRALWEEAIT